MGQVIDMKNGAALGARKPMIQFRPAGAAVMVKMLRRERSAGGILMAPSMEDAICEGEVVVVGPGRLIQGAKEQEDRIPSCVEIGDKILFMRPAALGIDLDNPDIFLVGEENIMAVRTY